MNLNCIIIIVAFMGLLAWGISHREKLAKERAAKHAVHVAALEVKP